MFTTPRRVYGWNLKLYLVTSEVEYLVMWFWKGCHAESRTRTKPLDQSWKTSYSPIHISFSTWPLSKIFSTDQHNLFLAELSEYFPPMKRSEIDTHLFVEMLSKYLQYKTSATYLKQYSSINQRFTKEYCLLLMHLYHCKFTENSQRCKVMWLQPVCVNMKK